MIGETLLKIIFKSVIITLIFANTLFPQNNAVPTMARTRILTGYSSLIRRSNKPILNSFFLNFNYRTSDFNPVDRSVRLGGALEIGANVALSVKEDYEGVACIPYIKTGPELTLTKNFIAGASFGFASLVGEYFAFGFFGGLNSYYLLPLDEKQYIEFEGGFHSVLFVYETSYMIYLSAGIAFR